MLDILIPTPAANQGLVPDCVEAIIKCTDVPFRVVVIADGGTRKDLQTVSDYFATYVGAWKLLHNPEAVYLNRTLQEGLDECVSRLVAIIAPQVRLDDVKWFGKVQQVFHRDPTTCLVDMWPNTKSSTLFPVKRAHTNPVVEGCHFALASTQFVKSKPPYGRVDPMVHWSRQAMASGGSSWSAPGVRFHVVDHRSHETWREPLASPNPSA